MIKPFGKILTFEFKRLICKRNLMVFFLLSLVILVVVEIAIISHNSFLKEKEILKEAEKEKVKQYHVVVQYGTFGFRFLFIPSPVSIFFADSMNGVLLSNINAAEQLKIYEPKKGKYFNESVGLMDFSGILFLVGCFFSLAAGFTVVRKRDFLKFHCGFHSHKRLFTDLIIARIIFINLILGLLVLLSFILSIIHGIRINAIFLLFILVASLLFLFLFLIGMVVGAIKEKYTALVVLVTVYFGAVFFIPWTIEKITQLSAASNIESLFNFELTNIKIYTKVERRLFEEFGIFKPGDKPTKEFIKRIDEVVANEFEEIFKRENNLKLSQLKSIKTNQIISSLFPTMFYLSLRKEMSSAGFLNLIDFHSFNLKMKKEFLKFYVKERLNEWKGGDVQNFIKGNENEFMAKSRLPYGFGLGIGVTVLLIIGFLFWACRLHLNRLKRESKGIDIDIDFEEGKNTVFVLCRCNQVKEEIINHYEQKDAVCLEKVNPDDFKFNGIKPVELLRHLSRVAGVDEKRARENLGIMGIDIDTAEKKKSDELILKIYAAVKTAADRQLIVINDFFKRESKQFEVDCINLLSHLISAGKKVICLSTEMYETSLQMDEQIKVDTYVTFSIDDIQEVTLR